MASTASLNTAPLPLGLSLWKNSILAAGAAYLIQGLTRNQSLMWLGLGANNIGPDGARAFASGLGASCLQWLGLGGNDLGDAGVVYLAGALKG